VGGKGNERRKKRKKEKKKRKNPQDYTACFKNSVHFLAA
jgi:hypothetical protein